MKRGTFIPKTHKKSEDPGIFWYIYMLYNVRTTWHPKRPPFFTRFSTELLDFLISNYPDLEFLRECLGVFSHMEIFCSNKKKHRQNTSSNSWRCIQFLQPLFGTPHLFWVGASTTCVTVSICRKVHPSQWTFRHRMSLKCKATSMMSMTTSTPPIWLTMTRGEWLDRLDGWQKLV